MTSTKSNMEQFDITNQGSSCQSSSDEGIPLLSLLLAEQQSLSAVDTFSRLHENHEIPTQSKYYQQLLPASKPGPGQQYAFEVDLDKCSGCKSCVTACHSMNGLDEEETWRDVGLLIGGTEQNPIMQHVTTACHHCLEPACQIACPVNAYEKNPITGIVKHLDDQCFGCQYCTLACPYDVPKYHSAKGIVRKCDMCSDRLAKDEAPACVQGCPHTAISIKVVDIDEVIENSEVDSFLPAAPEPFLTRPTTTYKSKKRFPRNTLPADYYAVNPQHPHWPLIIMLVLTQLSVGAFAASMLLQSLFGNSEMESFGSFQAAFGLMFGLIALMSSTMHLGRPQFAFRAVLGVTHSWLSREIIAFGLFAGAASVYAVSHWINLPFSLNSSMMGWSVVTIGIAAVFTSVMIYVFTQRDFWKFGITAAKFYCTMVLLGSCSTLFSLWVYSSFTRNPLSDTALISLSTFLAKMVLFSSFVKLAFEASFFLNLLERRISSLKRSAILMAGPLSNVTFARFALGILGGLVMPLLFFNELNSGKFNTNVLLVMVGISFFASLTGELLERYLFFAAMSSPRMPGSVRK